ncbi:MAG: hypothetical protein HDR00_15560 [Lachnospiraceae bacterium]|nr:hypothetical protein [Lachnospiraceae bacterium]
MRKEFPLRLLCFFVTVLMAVAASCFEAYEVNIVCTGETELPSRLSGVLGNYKIIIFFCVGIILCNFINKMKWMWMFSIGQMIAYPIICRIEMLEWSTKKQAWLEAFDIEVTSLTYTPLPASMLLRICSVLIFILCSILFFMEKKEQKRIAALIREKKEEEMLEEKRKDEEWKNSLFNADLLPDIFPSNNRDEES